MKQLIKNIIFGGAFVFLVASPVAVVTTPQATYAVTAADCEKTFLAIPPWYRGLTKDEAGTCAIVSPNEVAGGLQGFIIKIALNVIQIGLVIAGWIALFFILYGGFLFITGGSNASQIEKARKSILNAVIGLVISMGAIAITNLAFGALVGSAVVNPEFGVPQIDGDLLVRNGINLAFYIAGIVAVIVIIIAGVSYATSLGDAGKITRAKNMILYAVIGLVVLLAAFAITNFVMSRF